MDSKGKQVMARFGKKRLCVIGVALAFFSAAGDEGGFVADIGVYFVLCERPKILFLLIV
jgi:hypothetical protein